MDYNLEHDIRKIDGDLTIINKVFVGCVVSSA